MKSFAAGLLFLLCLQSALPSAHGQATSPTPTPAAQSEGQSAGGARAREFQGDDLGQVLRLLARQAKVNLIVDEAIKGNVSIRFENISAMDAIEAIAHQYKLTLTKDDKSVYYLSPPDAAEAALDLLAKPETAARIAAFKHNLYEALVKEGFTTDEAMQVMNESDLGATVAAFGKKPDAPAAK